MSSADDLNTDPNADDPSADPTAAERTAAEALAAAIDGPDVPASVDADALGAATLLAAHDGLELSEARFDAVAERIDAALDTAPRRRWLFVATPILAAAGLAIVILPATMTADAPAPMPQAAEAPAVSADAPTPPGPPPTIRDLPHPPSSLVSLQRRVIEGEADAVPAYHAALAAHRADILAAVGARR